MSQDESEETRKGPGRPRKIVLPSEQGSVATEKTEAATIETPTLTNEQALCPVCHSSLAPTPCLITKTFTDQRGVGFKGLICPECGIITVAKSRNGNFIYGYEDNWHLQD